ncbi:MAG: hypothetical protein ACLQNG_10240 [Acidimicrobiales bacterium]
MGSIAHLFSFQTSASVWSGALLAGLTVYHPTAVHAMAEAHDTPVRTLSCPGRPVGLRVGSIAHFFPFQASANI